MERIPEVGAASTELQLQALQWWLDAARRAGIDQEDFPRGGSLDEQIRWAKGRGLAIGMALARYSSKMQHSTDAQIRENVEGAAARKIFVPAQYLCVDEGVTGRKVRRDGLDRAKALLGSKAVQVILVYKASRLFRVAYRGYQFIQEEVVDEGMRAISVSQGIDTADRNTWKLLLTLHGLSDEMLLGTIADHVRSGLKALFAQGYVVGALTAGYRRVEVSGARPTNLGRPRTMPSIDEEAASHIRTAYKDVALGMPISRAWRKYRAAGGVADPRSRTIDISYGAFRRMLANRRYTGIWAFGRMRNVWSNKRDGNRPQEQSDTDVTIVRSEELRIIDDATFETVQAILAKNKLGPRGPKRAKARLQLADFIAEVLICQECKVRFHQAGANGDGMRCKKGSNCPAAAMIDRKSATEIICREVAKLLTLQEGLLRDVVNKAVEQDQEGSDNVVPAIETIDRRLVRNSNRLNDLMELLGEGTDEDRSAIKTKIRAIQVENKELTAERARLEAHRVNRKKLQPQEAEDMLKDLVRLFENAATGELGEEAVYRLLNVIKALSNGSIFIEAFSRPRRTRRIVRAHMQFSFNRLVETHFGVCNAAHTPHKVEFWLRPPPRLDRLAERVHELIDVQGLSMNETVDALRREGDSVRHGYVWQCYARYYEMQKLPLPKKPYNNGKPRRSA